LNKIIKIGADPFPPYQYFDKDGILRGSDYEMVKKTFDLMDMETEYVIKEWSEISTMMEEKELDAAFQVQATPERLKRFYFSGLFRNAVTEVITSNPNLELTNYAQIPEKGFTLGVIAGYTNGKEIDALPKKCKRFFEGTVALIKGISAGDVDLGIFDQGVKAYLMEQNGITNLYAIPAMTFLRPLNVIFNDGKLRDAFDEAFHKTK